MRRVALLAAAGLAAALFFLALASPSSADHNPNHDPPGQEEAGPPGNDGECTHGNSDQPCRPDPQPDRGKDCEPHGANFDGNEDHCINGDADGDDGGNGGNGGNGGDDVDDVDEETADTEIIAAAAPVQQPVAEVSPAVEAVLVAALPAAGTGPDENSTGAGAAAVAAAALVGVATVAGLLSRRQSS